LKVNQIHNSLSERYPYYYIGKPCICGFTISLRYILYYKR